MSKMNPVWRDKWADALESGRYTQYTAGTFSPKGQPNCQCVFGVLCQELYKEGFDLTNAEVLGLPWTKIMLEVDGVPRDPVILNDEEEMDFPTFAKLIREQL